MIRRGRSERYGFRLSSASHQYSAILARISAYMKTSLSSCRSSSVAVGIIFVTGPHRPLIPPATSQIAYRLLKTTVMSQLMSLMFVLFLHLSLLLLFLRTPAPPPSSLPSTSYSTSSGTLPLLRWRPHERILNANSLIKQFRLIRALNSSSCFFLRGELHERVPLQPQAYVSSCTVSQSHTLFDTESGKYSEEML